jgi:hypothetical protein
VFTVDLSDQQKLLTSPELPKRFKVRKTLVCPRVTRLGEYSSIDRFLRVVVKNIKSSAHFGTSFSPRTGHVIIFTKNGSGYILGHFLTNSSGHPGPFAR